MKKSLFLATFIMMSLTVSAEDDTVRNIELHSIDITTRSIVEVPEASISHEVLRVSFSSSGIYSLTVSDSLGSPVYISTLPADGSLEIYNYPGISIGYRF